MFKALIIDDEESTVNVLQLLIKKNVPEIDEVFTAIGAHEGLQMIQQCNPDLLFLDIEMPYMSGFELLENFPSYSFQVIFVTAYDHYAIKAIKYSALDYLLKPIDIEELQSSIHRFLESNEDYKQQYELLKNIMYNIQVPSADEFRLALPTKEGVHFLQPADIIRCEAVGNYTKFFVSGGKTYLISRTLGEYDTLLSPHQFIRTHKSHLVNKKFISFIDHDGFAVLKDSSRVEVSRRRKEEVMEALK